jgi:hypothetical protein
MRVWLFALARGWGEAGPSRNAGRLPAYLSASIGAVDTIPRTLVTSSSSRVMRASAWSCVSATYSAS